MEIIGQENGAANFRIDGVSVGVGKGETECERREFVDVRDKTPAVMPKGLHFQSLLMAALFDRRAAGLRNATVDHAGKVIVNGRVFEGAGADFGALGGAAAAEEGRNLGVVRAVTR